MGKIKSFIENVVSKPNMKPKKNVKKLRNKKIKPQLGNLFTLQREQLQNLKNILSQAPQSEKNDNTENLSNLDYQHIIDARKDLLNIIDFGKYNAEGKDFLINLTNNINETTPLKGPFKFKKLETFLLESNENLSKNTKNKLIENQHIIFDKLNMNKNAQKYFNNIITTTKQKRNSNL